MKQYKNHFLRSLINELDSIDNKLSDDSEIADETEETEEKSIDIDKELKLLVKVITMLDTISTSIKKQGLSGFSDKINEISSTLGEIKTELEEL